MNKVKFFESYSIKLLEVDINNFLLSSDATKIIDIKYSLTIVKPHDSTFYTALITYEK